MNRWHRNRMRIDGLDLLKGRAEERLIRWATAPITIIRNNIFVALYMHKLNVYEHTRVDASAIGDVLSSIFPHSRVVGDKYPGYVFHLDRIGEADELSRLIIYRDCRDVVSSTLKKVRTDWRNRGFDEKFDTASKVAKTWVDSTTQIERHMDKLHIIRYEDLVRDPVHELRRLGQFLQVDSAAFPVNMIRASSIGKFRRGLSKEELPQVMEIAGPAMADLGYI